MTLSVKDYWNSHIHDSKIAKSKVGTKAFFDELYTYHFEKLDYLPTVIDFSAYSGKTILGVGCGLGTDLLCFSQHGALVTGIDLSSNSIKLAKKNFSLHDQKGTFVVGDAEKLLFSDNSFDVVFMHSVLQYTPHPEQMIAEAHRVLKKGGVLLLGTYNKKSWLAWISRITNTPLEHSDAPEYHTFTFSEIKERLSSFSSVELVGKRFPKKTKLYKGIKAFLYNTFFVGFFSLIPKKLISRWGWHIIATATK